MAYQSQKKTKEDIRMREKLNKMKNKNRFVGVRQRASGKWAAEIKDTSKNIRMWLGTYQTAEEAARAYDEAACLLRGSNTRTNFSTHNAIATTNSPISLKLRNLLLRKAISNDQIQNNQSSSMISSPTGLQESASPMNSNIMIMEDKIDECCGGEGKSLNWVQNQLLCENQYRPDMNVIDCSIGIVPNTFSHVEYDWGTLSQQRLNELPPMLSQRVGLDAEKGKCQLLQCMPMPWKSAVWRMLISMKVMMLSIIPSPTCSVSLDVFLFFSSLLILPSNIYMMSSCSENP